MLANHVFAYSFALITVTLLFHCGTAAARLCPASVDHNDVLVPCLASGSICSSMYSWCNATTDNSIGYCYPLHQGIGCSCTEDAACSSGLYCGENSTTSINQCMTQLTPNSTCDTKTANRAQCVDGYFCNILAVIPFNPVPRCSAQLSGGNNCTYNIQCSSGYCDFAHNSTSPFYHGFCTSSGGSSSADSSTDSATPRIIFAILIPVFTIPVVAYIAYLFYKHRMSRRDYSNAALLE
jgi:cbb3-type cytochrome oxidase subunit 3